MFKAKFEDINMNSQPVKASQAKGIRNKLIEDFPDVVPYIDELWPKTAKVLKYKFKGDNTLSFVKIDDDFKFIEIRDR